MKGSRRFCGPLSRTRANGGGSFRSELKDIGRVFVVALVLDTTYQLVVLRWFYPVQLLIVAVACAVVPYALVRGPVTRLARALSRRRSAKEKRRG